MTIQEFINIDKTFNEALFLTKANHIFIKLFTCIMMDKLIDVKHFINEDVYNYAENIISPLRSKNYRQMYDELNVKNTRIKNIKIENDKVIIEVELISRYIDYFIDKDTLEYVSGINNRRIEKVNSLTFEKIIGVDYKSNIIKCPYCGASMDINSTGQCLYCRKIFNAEEYDWILVDIK